jgi:glycosyltransferase involved in cell wall biosynthesis
MNILHITPHLGGGVGKAHAVLRAVLPKEINQTFLLLEPPRDRRHADAIEAAGAHVVTANGPGHVAELAAAADIVQFEFWNHPRLFACLAQTNFPAIRSVFWSHVSGLFRPVIQPSLIKEAGRFVFTTEASLAILPNNSQANVAVINSGFGFAKTRCRSLTSAGTPRIAYLGTVDFAKMHPGFFDVIDNLDGRDICVAVWGGIDPEGPVVLRARAMRRPERIDFRGHADEPDTALSAADIFFYPLQPDHYGTAENALVEAMSLGLTPVVMNNPAEMAIVRHGETGFVARSIGECTTLLQMLLASPDVRERVSRNAVRYAAASRSPMQSAREFTALWQGLLNEPKKISNFRGIIGESPAAWFLATQCLPGETWEPQGQTGPRMSSKGTLAHFESVFPGDLSLSRLAGHSDRGAPLTSCASG